MESKSQAPASPAQRRLSRITDRIARINDCMERDKADKGKIAAFKEELEALAAEQTFMAFRAKAG